MLHALGEVASDVHDEPGCLLYATHVDGEHVVTIERWQSQADLESHGSGPVVSRLYELLGDSLAQEPQVFTLASVPFGDPLKGTLDRR